jgi:hypothetical protein
MFSLISNIQGKKNSSESDPDAILGFNSYRQSIQTYLLLVSLILSRGIKSFSASSCPYVSGAA